MGFEVCPKMLDLSNSPFLSWALSGAVFMWDSKVQSHFCCLLCEIRRGVRWSSQYRELPVLSMASVTSCSWSAGNIYIYNINERLNLFLIWLSLFFKKIYIRGFLMYLLVNWGINGFSFCFRRSTTADGLKKQKDTKADGLDPLSGNFMLGGVMLLSMVGIGVASGLSLWGICQEIVNKLDGKIFWFVMMSQVSRNFFLRKWDGKIFRQRRSPPQQTHLEKRGLR